MSFQRPTLSDLIDRIRADLSSRILGSSTALRRSTIGVLAIVWGGAVYLLYGFLAWIAAQVMPDTAEAEYAVRWASIKGLTQIAATFEEGTVTFPTTSDPQTIPTDTLMQSNDGMQYRATGDAVSAAGECVVSVICLTAGNDGQRDVDDQITLLSPIAAINSSGAWTETTVTGTDEETIEALQARMLLAFRTPPQGGAKVDYIQWAEQIAGVTRVWVFPLWLGAGTVGLTFVRDDDGTGAAIIPDAGEVAAVQAYVTGPTFAPVTANVTTFAPTAVVQNFTIHLVPSTDALKTLVEAALTNLIFREAVPGGTMYLSHQLAAIASVLGAGTFTLTAGADQVFANNQIGIMGTITWA